MRFWGMWSNPLKTKLLRGETALNAWCSLPCGYAAEILAHQGYDSVTIDLQHGAIHYDTAFAMLQAISTTQTTALARVPWNEPALMMKLLDAGALGIICPMINTRQDAERFVEACRYPPQGHRSFGPNRAVLQTRSASGKDYVQTANEQILLLAQVETRSAVENLDEILATSGLDGIYVGPGDLSMALGAPPSMAPTDPVVLSTIQSILRQTKAAGRLAAIHTDGPETALIRFDEGFQMCSLQSDARLLADGANKQVRMARRR